MTASARRHYSDPLPQGFLPVPRTVGPVGLRAATVSMGDALRANRGPVNRPEWPALSSGNHGAAQRGCAALCTGFCAF